MKIIFNIDDLGLTRGGVKAGLELLECGYAKSTTVMVNLIKDEELIELSKIPNISVGIHFNMEIGPALADTPLADDNGEFFLRGNAIKIKEIDKKHIRAELEAQYNRIIKFIPDITHIDSHHHLHNRFDNVQEVVLEFAKEKNLLVRENGKGTLEDDVTKDVEFVGKLGKRFFINTFYGKFLKDFPEKFKEYKYEGIADVMCHPAYCDDELMQKSSYNTYREKEIALIKQCNTLDWLEIMSYKDIPKN